MTEEMTRRPSSEVVADYFGRYEATFGPTTPGLADFAGQQLHTADYWSADGFVGRHVVVVGGGHSAVQHPLELAEVTTTTWVTRRPPAWRDTPFDVDARREAVGRVAERDGRLVAADVILWATRFRRALDHLAPLGLRDVNGTGAATTGADDDRGPQEP